jgi:hypothetical protein
MSGADTAAMEELLAAPAFGLEPDRKRALLERAVFDEMVFHREHNPRYRHWLDQSGWSATGAPPPLEELPYLHADVFKQLDLATVADGTGLKTLESSATSGVPSRVRLDRVTMRRQDRALVTVLKDVLGKERLAYVVFELDPAKDATGPLTARGAGLRGFLKSATDTTYVLEPDGRDFRLDIGRLKARLERAASEQEPVVVFGFTFLLYTYGVRALVEAGLRFRLPEGSVALHLGGWKKLEAQKVSRERLWAEIEQVFGIPRRRVFDFYGFTEQMGIVYPDCWASGFHVPAAAEVIIRDPRTMRPVRPGGRGPIQVVTFLPHSYPGVSVLTDDLGELVMEDGCACGRRGRVFRVLGRVEKAEARGCSDMIADGLQSAAAGAGA